MMSAAKYDVTATHLSPSDSGRSGDVSLGTGSLMGEASPSNGNSPMMSPTLLASPTDELSAVTSKAKKKKKEKDFGEGACRGVGQTEGQSRACSPRAGPAAQPASEAQSSLHTHIHLTCGCGTRRGRVAAAGDAVVQHTTQDDSAGGELRPRLHHAALPGTPPPTPLPTLCRRNAYGPSLCCEWVGRRACGGEACSLWQQLASGPLGRGDRYTPRLGTAHACV